MARPQKNNADYFSHDSDMRNDIKIKAVRNKFGVTGYTVWCMMLEYLTSCSDNVMPDDEITIELISGDFGVSVTEIKDVLNYCYLLGLLIHENNLIFSAKLKERLAPIYEKRAKAKEYAERQSRNNGKFDIKSTVQTEVSVTETPQSKVNKSKVNKSNIEKDIVAAKAAALSRRDNFYNSLVPFTEKYSKDMIRSFFDYWSELDRTERKMRFEKQTTWELGKRLATWFKKEPFHGNTKHTPIASDGSSVAGKAALERTNAETNGLKELINSVTIG
ncbi:DUF4373 domain-containing protein [uncultured Bacteroides sp.]|uniref:DUF4373 domain-containing protein n=1 Tax=uncultured Bacteroides sp. TaxID=162156 RepID=UPI002AABFC59|nr:DUF4373 domain-containing protein [uncultured Bacteroides sp.]